MPRNPREFCMMHNEVKSILPSVLFFPKWLLLFLLRACVMFYIHAILQTLVDANWNNFAGFQEKLQHMNLQSALHSNDKLLFPRINLVCSKFAIWHHTQTCRHFPVNTLGQVSFEFRRGSNKSLLSSCSQDDYKRLRDSLLEAIIAHPTITGAKPDVKGLTGNANQHTHARQKVVIFSAALRIQCILGWITSLVWADWPITPIYFTPCSKMES